MRDIYYEQQQNNTTRNPELTNLLLLMGLVLLVFVASKRGWFQKITPSFVWISVTIKRNKVNKERIVTISISNHTKNSLTFDSPVMVFGSVLGKRRKFKIKGNSDQAVFPLTLMPGTGHKLTMNLDTFRQKAGIIKGLKWVKAEVETDRKTYSSFWKYQF